MTAIPAPAGATPGQVSGAAGPALMALGLGVRRVAGDRGGLVFTAVFHLMVTSVLAGLWRTAATGNGGQIVGYSATALVWYVATTEAAVVSLPFRLIDDIGSDIVSGAFETELLRPVSPLVPRLAGDVGQMLPRLGVCAATGTAFALVVGGRPPSLAALALAAPSLVLAATLNATAQYAFAGATFWVRDARGAWFLYQKLVFVLGGMLLPLQVLPPWLQTTAEVLPFSAMAYAPARLASGHLEPQLLAIQAGWLVAALGATVAIHRAGERHLVMAGGAGS